MRKKVFLISIFAVLQALTLFGQTKILDKTIAFGDGERLTYTVSFNWGWIWIDAGMVDFSVKNTTFKEEQIWHFLSTGHSLKKFDWLYMVRDTFEAKITMKDIQPLWFQQHTNEGGNQLFNEYNFNYSPNFVTIKTKENKNDLVYDSIAITQATYDVLTATYIARSMDFDQMQLNDTVYIKIILDGALVTLPIVFHGHEIVKNKSSKSYNCIKFSTLVEKGTMFKSGELLTVWISNDKNKIPILIEAKITIGSIKVYLNSFQNLKHPFNGLLVK